jgi:hypothetical protein
MELTSLREIHPFEMNIDRYERAFHDRDLAAFRALHVHDGRLVFFDNHAGCDSSSYSDHEAKVRAFFESGAIATSGRIPLIAAKPIWRYYRSAAWWRSSSAPSRAAG